MPFNRGMHATMSALCVRHGTLQPLQKELGPSQPSTWTTAEHKLVGSGCYCPFFPILCGTSEQNARKDRRKEEGESAKGKEKEGVDINRNLDINIENLTQKLTNNDWATNLQVIGPYHCECRHVLVPAHGHPYHPQVRGCAAPCAVAEEPNGELGPTTTGARIRIPTHNEGEGPCPIDGVH